MKRDKRLIIFMIILVGLSVLFQFVLYSEISARPSLIKNSMESDSRIIPADETNGVLDTAVSKKVSTTRGKEEEKSSSKEKKKSESVSELAPSQEIALSFNPDPIFYESFDNLESITNNSGTIDNAPINFVEGIKNNAANLSGSKRINYPMQNNFNPEEGTIQFWIKKNTGIIYGMFDFGSLTTNAWAIFRNGNYAIMEVKNSNSGDIEQAWSPNQIVSDDNWHFVVGKWKKTGANTYFKVCLDGKCKASYDGIQDNTVPNLNGNFRVGWTGWTYGYFNGIMDEFKIYDYEKTDAEIKEEYNDIANPYTPICNMSKPQSKGNVQLNCSGLYVNNEPFFMKGVGYQPIPIGKTAQSIPDKQLMYNDIWIRERDFPLLRDMNANTIRIWSEMLNKSFMEDIYNNGTKPVYVIMGFWINCHEDYGNAVIRQGYIDAFTDYVNEYKDSPSVLMWALGNENNLGYCSSAVYMKDYYRLCNDLAEIAYNIEGENYHPVTIVNGNLGFVGDKNYFADDLSLDYIDSWGINIYNGDSFGTFFDDYSDLSGKPLWISEYGTDALNDSSNQEIESVQADWNLGLWNEIVKSNITIGGTVMAWSDEWWKGEAFGCNGSKYTHEYHCGHDAFPTPDGFSNEEWFGIMRTVDNGTSPDILEPRQSYYDFKEAFFDGVYPECNPADIDGDGDVDYYDLQQFQADFGTTGCMYSDMNDDLVVDSADYITLKRNMGFVGVDCVRRVLTC
ncbi:MAG: LamG-like jellyroll fold domain-containing protein [Nanoarchaeota archaeon]